MTTDTTPRADHAARIHAATVTIHEAVEDQLLGSSEVSAIVALDTIDDAAAALEAARRDAEARAKRLNDALRIVAAIADERGKRLSPYSPDTLSEDAQSEMGLHPGDVRRIAGPQRGGVA